MERYLCSAEKRFTNYTLLQGFFVFTLFSEFPQLKLTITKIKTKWSSIRDAYFERMRKNRQASGAGFKEPHVGKLDELLTGLNDAYETEPYVI